MSLMRFYESVLYQQRFTSVTAKVALAAVLYLVAMGNKYPGNRLILGVLVAQLIVASLLATGGGIGGVVLALSGLTAAALVGWLFVPPQPEFQVVPSEENGAWKPLALAGFAVAFFYPFIESHIEGFWNAVYTPMGLIPQPSFLAVMILAAQSEDARVKLVGRIVAGLSIVVGITDLLGGVRLSGTVMLAAASGFIAREIVAGLQFAKENVEAEPARRRAAGPASPRPVAPAKPAEKPKSKKWDI